MKVKMKQIVKTGCKILATSAAVVCTMLACVKVDVNAANLHTVTFMYGAKIKTQQVVNGMNAVIPTDTNQDGFNFLGWVGNAMCVTEDRIIIGAYAPKTADEKWTVHPSVSVPESSFPINIYGLQLYKQDPTVKFNNAVSAPEPEWWKDLNIPKGVPVSHELSDGTTEKQVSYGKQISFLTVIPVKIRVIHVLQEPPLLVGKAAGKT